MKDFFEQLDAMYQSGRQAEVESFLQETLQRVSNGQKITVLNELAGFYRGVSRYEDSVAAYLSALMLLEAAGQRDKPFYSTIVMNAAGTLRLAGRLSEAEEMYKKVLDLLDPEDYVYASTQNNLSLVLQDQGKYKEAQVLAEQALEWVRCHGAPDHEVATSLNNLANIHMNMGDVEYAGTLIKESLAIYDAMEKPNVHHAAALSFQGVLCYRQKDLDGAKAAFERALSLTEYFFGKNIEYKQTLQSLKVVRKAQETAGDEGEAI